MWDEGCDARGEDEEDDLGATERHLHEEGADLGEAEAVDDYGGELVGYC